MSAATMEEALADAINWLAAEPPENRLTSAGFGRYADGTGYWWTLRLSRDIRDGAVDDPRQDNRQRLRVITTQWAKDTARLAGQEAP